MKSVLMLLPLFYCSVFTNAQPRELSNCNLVWTSQSSNASGSMPCGGGGIGLNVWVEKGELLFYVSRSGTFDDNNGFLKLGRVRVKLTPDPFSGRAFRQELALKDGYVSITGSGKGVTARVNVWVDVFHPVIHLEVNSNKPLLMEAGYESWRTADRQGTGSENNANSFKWSKTPVITYKDDIGYQDNGVLFYHRNKNDHNAFDVTVRQQGLEAVKAEMFNPLKNLVFGGWMQGSDMQPAGTYSGKYINTAFTGWRLKSSHASRSHRLQVFLHTAASEKTAGWQNGLQEMVKTVQAGQSTAWQKTRNWWNEYWNRSFLFIQPGKPDPQSAPWQCGRNYQLFRYMLGCNAYGTSPTKFNGGLFTYDPALVDSAMAYTPDYRNWGGGLMTAQNQRLVYYPMLKSGDAELMKPQFDFYLNALHNAELRSRVYWGHPGACFPEQVENFGLPNSSEYGWKRPETFDKGIEYNAWMEYEWDTVLEFCFMMLETERYTGRDISAYLPFIESCVTFFTEHYRYLARQRGIKEFDGNGHIVFYPGSAAETYKMAYNSTTTISALSTVLTRMLELPAGYANEQVRAGWKNQLSRIPPIAYAQFDGHTTIAPARL